MNVTISSFPDISSLGVPAGEAQYENMINAFLKDNTPRAKFQETIALNPDKPVFFESPNGADRLICLLAWSDSPSPSRGRAFALTEEPGGIKTEPMLPVEWFPPRYPNELKSIKGDVLLRVSIDTEGNVTRCKVIRPLHPYIDYCARWSVYRWKFAPFAEKGRKFPTEFDLVCSFDPKESSNPTGDRRTGSRAEGQPASLPKRFRLMPVN